MARPIVPSPKKGLAYRALSESIPVPLEMSVPFLGDGAVGRAMIRYTWYMIITPLAYTAAALSSICFGSASILEQIGTKHVKTISSLDPRQYMQLIKQWQYIAGLMLDGLGFLFFVLAVRSLPLYFVQAVDTASIAVTALGGHFIMRAALGRREYRAMLGMFIGLLGLAFVSTPETSERVDQTFIYSLLAAAGFTIVATAILARWGSKKPTFLALLSGLSFCGVAVASRIAPGTGPILHILFNPVTVALAVFGVLGLLLFSMALQKGSATIVYAITFVTETVIPATIGIWFLGDSPRHGLWAVLIGSLAITVGSTIFLAGTNAATNKDLLSG